MRLAARRSILAVAAAATAVATTVAASPGASAAPIWTLHYTAKVSTYVKKPGKTVNFTGTQTTMVDIGALKNNVSAALSLKPGTMTVDLPLIPGLVTIPGIATATLQIEPTGPAKGNFDSGNIDVTQYFNVQVTKLTPPVLSFVNLVPDTCKTATPASMHLTGKITNIFSPFSMHTTYTLPSFANCGLLTGVITSLTSGSGNTVTATFTPAAG
ncbi:hypothetical protein [Rudaeicoccus suwonensis]|uniref:Dehydratase n=1 Tax=Rudaeicoccus suwonensis TaxID=657409 RepID=A0A561E9Q9_9MICO|nr:hypothetical protein [Rudaeicoccus suwonensis]TWE12346.1 hypothetical protein BKA23_1149 [Rudaeicoccus suwonensis]